MATKRERVAEILRRLTAAPPAATGEAVLALLREVTNAVEDELSGLPYDPEDAMTMAVSARMYPPLADSEKPGTIPGVRAFKTAGHEIFVASNGALLIRHHSTHLVVCSKAGADGKEIVP